MAVSPRDRSTLGPTHLLGCLIVNTFSQREVDSCDWHIVFRASADIDYWSFGGQG
jgi:hypothetical protein